MRYVSYKSDVSKATLDSVIEDLPEIQNIKDDKLRDRVTHAWAFALTNSSFSRISDIQGAGNPDQIVLVSGDQSAHLRGVATIAMALVDEFETRFPQVAINRDIVLAGALCHDIGKPWEFDPENLKRWRGDPSANGEPSLRHSVYGAHICLMNGLPEEVAHIALGHSMEGQHIGLSTECLIVRAADHTWWQVANSLGLIKAGTADLLPNYIRPRTSGVAPT
ncbi:HD domain-containing protein [Pikeienuella sp. HZG-20]|uniref:HD domain-containing protein n=1 Tax=Paludibacillus litoralis TaxID=3133267 RepID=UPI0030EDB599